MTKKKLLIFLKKLLMVFVGGMDLYRRKKFSLQGQYQNSVTIINLLMLSALIFYIRERQLLGALSSYIFVVCLMFKPMAVQFLYSKMSDLTFVAYAVCFLYSEGMQVK